MNKTEHYINVPLAPRTKDALSRQARTNGRSQGREAARLIERGLRPLLRQPSTIAAAR